MKRLYLFSFVLLLAISMVFAAGGEAGVSVSGNSGNLDASGSTGNQGDSGAENDSGQGNQNEVVVQTMNQGESSQLQVQTNSEFGTTLQSGNAEAKTSMKMTQEQDQNKTKVFAELSNGMKSEIKVMPDTASEKALEVLNAKCEETGCSIELKEVGKGNTTKAAYKVEAKKEVKVLGLFKSQMNAEAQVDAETGEVIKTRHAWWGFLASKK